MIKNKIYTNRIIGGGMIMLFFLFFHSCSEWNDHYDLDTNDSANMYTILKSQSEYSDFVSALESTGYDKVLSGQEVFTVMIPESELLKETTLSEDEFKKLIGNHIFLGRYFLRDFTDTLKVQTLSGKYYDIIPEGSEVFRLSNRENDLNPIVSKSNIQSRNGVAHSINGLIETVPNIKELIDGLDPDKYSIFLSEYNKLDSINSELNELRLGLNEKGEVVRDTFPYWVYPAFNPADESKDMTLLVPSNEAVLKQKSQLLALNGGDADKISLNYYVRLFRNQVLTGAFPRPDLLNADTILTEGMQKVVGKKLNWLGIPEIASNGYVYESSKVTYKPIAADFIDSVSYEAEWSLGPEGHERTIIYDGANIPIELGDDITLNKHLYCFGLNNGDRINMFIPNVYAGLYEVKLVYKQSDIIVRILSENKIVSQPLNLETLVPFDPNNEDPNVFPNVSVGYVLFPETGYLNIEFQVIRGVFSSLVIDKVILVPIEY